MHEIIGRVREYVVANFLYGEGEGFENSTSFLDGGIIDSTGILEVVEFITSEFSVEISDLELVPENLDSVDNIARFVCRKKDLSP